MENSITWVGMDVHAENIVLAALRDSSDAVLFRAEFPNNPKGRERLAGRLAGNAPVRCVYEAGPCGYELRRFLEDRSIECDVAAPALSSCAGSSKARASNATSPHLSPENPETASRPTARTPRNSQGVTAWENWPPFSSPPPRRKRCAISSGTERMPGRICCVGGTGSRSSSCARGGATPRGNAGRRGTGTGSVSAFTERNAETVFREYIVAIEQEVERIHRIEQQIVEESRSPEVGKAIARLRALRGVDTITAMTIITEVIDLNRFRSPRGLMAFIGVVPRERSKRRKRTTRKHHEDRERPHPPRSDRIGVALPAAPCGNTQDDPRPDETGNHPR